MNASHVTRTEDGGFACRYCGRRYEDADGVEGHVDALARAGMLQDHIAIHWTESFGKDEGSRGAPAPRSWIEAFTMRFEE